MADSTPKTPKDRHPELSAPILDLSLEARIARAEQAVIDRDARLRVNALNITDTLRSRRGAAVRWAGIAGAAAAVGAIGYAGYSVWRGRKRAPADEKRPAQPAIAAGFASEIAAIARVAARWVLKLHREQGVSGSLFGVLRSALWPSAGVAPPPPPTPHARETGLSNTATGLDIRP